MNDLQKRIILVVFVSILTSCSSPFNCKKRFQIFKEPIITGAADFKIQLNGIYVSKNGAGSMVFYADGSYKTIYSNDPDGQLFWKNPDSVFKTLSQSWNYKSKETWGHYLIKNDSITIQSFGRANDQLCKRSVYEKVGEVINDSTISIYSNYSYWFKSELLDEPNIFGFYPTNHKPDSTKAWFNNRRWFIRNLNESRR